MSSGAGHTRYLRPVMSTTFPAGSKTSTSDPARRAVKPFGHANDSPVAASIGVPDVGSAIKSET